NVFVIGNHTNFNAGWRNPGSGRVDEFAIWHRVLAASEITNQFNALAAPAAAVPPALTITRSGDNILLSWPSDAPGNFVLETTNILNAAAVNAPAWPDAGAPARVGSDYVVTNAISEGNQFYRLRSQ